MIRFLLLFLVAASPCLAQRTPYRPEFLSQLLPKAAVGGGGGEFDFEETFEGSNDNTWTIPFGGVDLNNTTTPIAGAQSAYAAPSEFKYAWASIPLKDQHYWKFKFNSAGFATGGNAKFTLSRNGVADDCVIQIQSNGKVVMRHGAGDDEGDTTIVTGQVYTIWLDWVKGTGSNGTFQFYISTTDTKPGAPDGGGVDGSGQQPDVVTLQWGNNDACRFDALQSSTSPIP
ncbi:MAG TPA: hypothetical protein VNO50_10775 [Pyrinomonadaceae bacterium]|nr:hypothetical protein [Pyrinomonadaceae bacterium]